MKKNLNSSEKLIISLNNLLENIDIKELNNNKEKISERLKCIKNNNNNKNNSNKYY